MNWAAIIDYGSILGCSIVLICFGYFSKNPKFKRNNKFLLLGWALAVITVVRIAFALSGTPSNVPPEGPNKLVVRVLKEGKLAVLDEECSSPRGFKVTIPGGYRYLFLANNPDGFLMALGPNQEVLVVGSEKVGQSNGETVELAKKKWLQLQSTARFGPEVTSHLQYDRVAIRMPISYVTANKEVSGTIMLVPINERALALVAVGPASFAKFNEQTFARFVSSLQPQYTVRLD